MFPIVGAWGLDTRPGFRWNVSPFLSFKCRTTGPVPVIFIFAAGVDELLTVPAWVFLRVADSIFLADVINLAVLVGPADFLAAIWTFKSSASTRRRINRAGSNWDFSFAIFWSDLVIFFRLWFANFSAFFKSNLADAWSRSPVAASNRFSALASALTANSTAFI